MSDPFLDAHRIGERYFQLSGPSPISLRDQILRGALIIQRMIDNTEIADGQSLLVIGAGVAGAAAAITAARKRIHTVLVDAACVPFSTLRNASTRFVDPTQYDWPLDHYGLGIVPWNTAHVELPLRLRRGFAPILAAEWTRDLEDAELRYAPFLKRSFKSCRIGTPELANPAKPSTSKLRTVIDTLGRISTDAVIDASGFGEERCGFPRTGPLVYEGQAFWSQDSFTNLPHTVSKVLISGGGDGALQDYIRIVTRENHPLRVFHGANLDPGIIAELQSAEDRAHRGRAWAKTSPQGRACSRHEAPYLQELDSIHHDIARWAISRDAVRQGLNRMVTYRPAAVTLVHPQPFLTCHYGLNRFLTHLLTLHIDQTFGGKAGVPVQTRFPSTQISSIAAVDPSSHDCVAPRGGRLRAAGHYNREGALTCHACFGKPHAVTFAPGSATAPPPANFDVIILRHGVQASRDVVVPRPRQLLPFHLPA